MTTNPIRVADVRTELPLLGGGSCDLIIADPPYRIKSWEGFGSNHNRTYGTPPPEYGGWLPECRRVLKDSGSIFVFETPANVFGLRDAMNDAGFIIQPPLCWFVSFRKSHPRKGWYNSHWEPIMWGTKTDKWYFDNTPLRGGGSRYGGDVYEAASVQRAKVPGQKPLKMIERLVAVHTPSDGLVLDLFSGSGTTAVACKNLGRDSISIEYNRENAEYILERLEGIK